MQVYSLNLNIFTIAIISTIIEQFSIFGVDNLIVPISAAIAAPALPATIKPAKTGDNSLVIERTTTFGIALSAENLENPVYKSDTFIPLWVAKKKIRTKKILCYDGAKLFFQPPRTQIFS